MYEDYAVKTENTNSLKQQIITKQNAWLAYDEIFKMWKIDLTEDQKKKVKDVYFNQAWKKFSEDGNLNFKDAYRFQKELMTTPLIPPTSTSVTSLSESDSDVNDSNQNLMIETNNSDFANSELD